MSESPTLVYLEADDEITAVVRRVRVADPGRVVIIAPGRSRATSSAVALRLLARAGEEVGRELAVVGDPLTRSLAAEAGLAAFATIDEARRAEPGARPPAAEPRHATIHVVRGSAADDTVATPIATAADLELTRTVPVTRARAVSRPAPRRRRTALAGILAVAAVLLVGFVTGAAVLPAASISIAPRTDPVGPTPDVFAVSDVERLTGTVSETATVTATGRFEILRPATGTVVLYNWTFFPVSVPAGTFVAAGRQAFATQADVVVPRGSLTAEGRIRAGDIAVEVDAAEPGPAANVGPNEINVVVDQEIDAQLRGFPENPEPRVLNPKATRGGRDDAGIEITEDDVQSAERLITETLREAAAVDLAGSESAVGADPTESIEIGGLDDLIGMRGTETVEIRGSLTYDSVTADRAVVEALAIDRFRADLPAGSQLVEGGTRVEIGEVLRAGDGLSVKVTVTGRVARTIDRSEVVERVMGRTADDAEAALADLGDATVELWPRWVGSVPSTDWRIDVRVAGP